jgi:hypothetical protein
MSPWKYAGLVELMAPDVAFQEAQEHLPGILGARKIPVARGDAGSFAGSGANRGSGRTG